MSADFDDRAASLAVSRYGVDRARVIQAAEVVAQQIASGASCDLLERLVSDNILTTEQAERAPSISTARSQLHNAVGHTQRREPTADHVAGRKCNLGVPTAAHAVRTFLRELGGIGCAGWARRHGDGIPASTKTPRSTSPSRCLPMPFQ